MARSIECKCEARFTCGYCLRNAKPYLFTPSTSREQASESIEARSDRAMVELQIRNPQLFLEHASRILAYDADMAHFFGNMRAIEVFARAMTAIRLEEAK